MPRFSSWHSSVPPDPAHHPDLVIDEVLRPSLQRVYPLSAPEQDEDPHFRFLLDALTYVSQGKS